MPQKFMFIAVAGYVLCASVASILVTSSNSISNKRRFSIILLHWAAILIFVVASFADTQQITPTPISLMGLMSSVGFWGALTAGALISLAYGRPELSGWWSPLPWIRGVIGITLVSAWLAVSIESRHALLPDWRFVGTSLVLWAVCLILAELALLPGGRGSREDSGSRMVRELLRLCAALPALLVYLIGVRL